MYEVEVKISDSINVDVNLCAPVVIVGEFNPITIENSDGSFSITLNEYPQGGVYQLANIVHTDSDGSTVETPAQIAFSAEACEVFQDVLIRNSSGTYTLSLSSGQNTEVPDSVITEIDGSSFNLPATEAGICRWFSIRLVDSKGATIDTISEYPSGGNFPISDQTVTQVDGSSSPLLAGTDALCQWFDIEIRNSAEDVLEVQESYPANGRT